MLELIEVALSAGEALLANQKNQLPENVVTAVAAAVQALAAHKADLLTKANFDAQRG